MRDGELDDLCSRIAKQLDVYEFLDILEFTMEDLVVELREHIRDLMEYLIKTYTNEGETVLDFTAGSFTTGVACVNLDRRFIGIEMDEGYFEIGVSRIKEAMNGR